MSYELQYFRAAVIESSERKSDLFHNHQAESGVIYRYPLIQYKIINKRPAIICLEAATDDIHYLLQNKSFEFRIKDKKMTFQIEDMHMTYVQMQTWEKDFGYNLLHYIPFNQENYKVYKSLKSEIKRIQFLEERLNSHLIGIMKQLGVAAPVKFRSEINDILSTKYIEYKGQFHLTFNLNISCNLLIANYLGVGKGVTLGFGIIKSKND
jgi:hypothetical protein